LNLKKPLILDLSIQNAIWKETWKNWME
jgi:hypothetical protein